MSIPTAVDLAAEKIAELSVVDEGKLLSGVRAQVRSLKEELGELGMARSLLNDMETMDEEEGDERSHAFVKKMRKIIYDAEDVVDTYTLEANSSANNEMEDVCSSLSRVSSKIEAIEERLNKTRVIWREYMLEKGVNRVEARQKRRPQRARPPAYSHTHEEHVVGLDEDINKLVGVLTHEDHHNINFVSVVGMGGSGKTTLARKLFNHDIVKKYFDCLAWVSVSQQWNAEWIILDLLNKFTGDTMGARGSPVEKIHQYLERKSYLIVLDDVWELEALAHICTALPLTGDKRKIIVTTRNEEVVSYNNLKRPTYSHEPRRLTEEESWELFTKIALINRPEVNITMDIAKLEELGKEMLKKCRGLPLAVIALAGILFHKVDLEEWKKVSFAVSARIRGQGRGTLSYGPVKDMLELSYIDLPSELKPCFLYLAQYPEDCEIRVRELIKTWIAEGFIVSREGWALEDVARQYLDELLHRCLILVDERYHRRKLEVKYIRIHDLVRDLSIEKAKKQDFLGIFTPNSNTTKIEARRDAFDISQDKDVFAFPANSPFLRSLFIRGKSQGVSNLSVEAVHRNFRLLRVLIIESIETSSETLPEGIGSLIHLRYLGSVRTDIKVLPSSIGNLRNLLMLNWDSTLAINGEVFKIPDVIWKLELLTHLSLPGQRYHLVDVETLKLHTLKSLQTLQMSVGGGNWMVEELPRLSPTIQKLSIREIRSQELLDAAFRCPSIRDDRLRSLCLSWRDGITLENIEEYIIHCQHLRKLHLDGRIVGDGLSIQFPASINKLYLSDTGFEAEDTLRALGKLLNLTVMTLIDNAYMGSQWTCRAGEFPKLKELNAWYLDNLEEWSIESGAMPQLGRLQISFCKKLRKLPEGLKFITTLQHLHVKYMDNEFKERIKAGGEDAHIIQHVPRVVIM